VTKKEKAAYDKVYKAKNRERVNANQRAWSAKRKRRALHHKKYNQ
jgi:hypothetical protein